MVPFDQTKTAMTQLDDALLGLKKHEGVEHVLLAGMDGLLVRHLGEGAALDADRVAALVPGVIGAAHGLGRGAGAGDAATVVLELASAVAIITALSPDLILAVLLRPAVAFPALLHEIRRNRGDLAALV